MGRLDSEHEIRAVHTVHTSILLHVHRVYINYKLLASNMILVNHRRLGIRD